MLWNTASKLKPSDFKRKTGFNLTTFQVMVEVIKEFKQRQRQKDKRGNQSSFSTEDEVLIMLWYYREYVTYFSIAKELGVAESTICRIVGKTESILIKSRKFTLPGKKKIRDENGRYKVIIIDATEQPIERPIKDRVKLGKKNQEQKE